MKPKEKESLARNRGLIVRTLDVTAIMEMMREQNGISKDDEKAIMSDPRRRQRAARLLDILEKKKTQAYDVFMSALEEHYPHLYLAMTDWEDDGGADGFAMDDEWTPLRRCRKFLIEEIDATNIVNYCETKLVISPDETKEILNIENKKHRTEVFLDILETKAGNAYDIFLESISEVYPHIYLMLTDQDEDEFEDDDPERYDEADPRRTHGTIRGKPY